MTQAAGAPRLALRRGSSNNSTGSWESDYLGREKYAVQLERLIANSSGPYVIGMTSSWGSGKTFFLTAWRKSLLERRRPCVYFNAWETDHAGDPLVALAAHISQQVKEQLGIEDAIFGLIQAKANQIARKAPKALVGALIALFNRYSGSEIPNDLAQLASDAFEMGTAGFLQTEKARGEFKKAIRDLAKKAIENRQISEPDPVNNSTSFPLLVMIDELDRCRPDYAITLLESIKHLFNEPGIVFLISMDSDQILSVIEHTFGLHGKTQDISSNIRQNYLRKFIDIFWALPDSDASSFVLQNLLAKRPTIPQDWPEVHRWNAPTIMDFQDDNPFFSRDSYYFTLASAAMGKQKSLRELLQILEKFFLISMCYKMNTRECLVIFDMLMNCADETKNQNMSSIIAQTEFAPQSASRRIGTDLSSERDISDQDPFLALYLFIIENSHKQSVPRIKPSGETFNGHATHTSNEKLVEAYLERILTRFSGKDLIISVAQKIAFLDEFHFGE